VVANNAGLPLSFLNRSRRWQRLRHSLPFQGHVDPVIADPVSGAHG
jgi:hypothetical protein